ncbi:MAG: restriction endonuclease subunit S [Oligosphaeraceae bacterium]
MSNWKLLGELIEQRREKNDNYDVPIRGVTRDGFIPPKQAEADLSLYNVFYKDDFVFNPARMELNSIALNTEYEKGICSSLYEIFYIKDTSVLLPSFLNLYLKREEFARYCWFDAIGSARNYYRVSNIKAIPIPVPPIEVQRSMVAAWQGLRDIQAQNERLTATLMPLCRSYLQDLKHKYEAMEIGEFIEQCDERNSDGTYDVNAVRGISIDKKVIPTKANMEDVSLTPYKLFKPKEFCFVTITSRNGGKISLACNEDQETHIVSSSYEVFRITDHNQLAPEYLSMLFRRAEFDRYARFNSWGSAREAFSYADMARVRIPLPPIEVQRAIVEVFQAAQNAKRMAEKAAALSREICPALIQRAIHS